MPNERNEKLQKLQIKREQLINEILKEKIPSLKGTYIETIKKIKDEMSDLNKLDSSEKNIHAIWIGILPRGELDNLKLWAKYNPEYKIHIWTDYTHILAHRLNRIISDRISTYNVIVENPKSKDDKKEEHSYATEANTKDWFYSTYHLSNSEKTFDENVKKFLLDKNINGIFFDEISEHLINKWIKDAKEIYLQEQADIKKYTPNEVIIHDVNQEKDMLFPSKEYYEGYLQTLEHLNICAGASDRLRYAVLDKFGGVYLDTDVAMKFNLQDVKNDQEMINLIDQIECNKIWKNKKDEIILNQIVLLNNLNQLNDENLKNFAEKWNNMFNGSVDKNFSTFKAISKKIKNMNLDLIPEMKLADFPLDNALAIAFHTENKIEVGNAFIVSKKNSNFLQNVMKGIETTDEKLKKIEMNTYTKLINTNRMILHHTGPNNIALTIKSKDENYFYLNSENSQKIITLQNANSYLSSWYYSPHKDAITNPDYLRSFFYTYPNELVNFDQLKEKFKNYNHEKKSISLVNNHKKEKSDFERTD